MHGNRNLLLLAIVCAIGLPGAAQPVAPRDLGPRIFQAQWVSVSTLPQDPASIIPFPWGNDPIEEGELEVRARGWLKADLEGVKPDSEYTLWACTLTSAPGSRCSSLGAVSSDSKGKADAILPWPDSASGPHAVFFVLTRNQTTMFVSGFHMPADAPPVAGPVPPAPPKPSAGGVELKGGIGAVGSGAFTVGGIQILVDAKTRFDGHAKSFADLRAGMTVEVDGVPAPGGLLAVRVQTSGKK
jgi:hypothetical protein